MKELNVLYTLDSAYLKYMLVSLYSLIENNQDLDIKVHIIYDDFTINDFKLIETSIKSFNNINIFFYDFNNIKNIINEYNISNWRGKSIPNARLFFNEIIKDTDKLLYLDSDTIVIDSVNKLNNYDGTVNMVVDAMPKYYWKELDPSLKNYYNSGVMYIDVDKWRKNNCDSKIVETIIDNQNYTYPDQDIINMALKNDISSLPPEYNLFSTDAYYNPFILSRHYSQNEIERYDYDTMKKAKKNPIILHSTPFYSYHGWDNNPIHPYHIYYMEYFNKIGIKPDSINNLKINPTFYKLYLNTKLLFPKEFRDKVKKLIRK
nr:glycosyltransferase family 8 protein [Bacilli bacterium]